MEDKALFSVMDIMFVLAVKVINSVCTQKVDRNMNFVLKS